LLQLRADETWDETRPPQGRIKGGQYIFAGSYELVDAKTGTVKTLVTALLADGPQTALQRPLPGSAHSIYDALGGCLP